MNRRTTQFKEREQPREQIREQPREQIREQPREQSREIKEQPKEVLKTFLNKDISITLRSGNNMRGKLEMVTHFEIIITVDQKPLLVMKHAIDYVELVG